MKVRVIVDVDGVSKEVVVVEGSDEPSDEGLGAEVAEDDQRDPQEDAEADDEDRLEPPQPYEVDEPDEDEEDEPKKSQARARGELMTFRMNEADLRFLLHSLSVFHGIGLSEEAESTRWGLEYWFKEALQEVYVRPRINARRRDRRREREWERYSGARA